MNASTAVPESQLATLVFSTMYKIVVLMAQLSASFFLGLLALSSLVTD